MPGGTYDPWNTGIECECGEGTLFAFVKELGPNWINYAYVCKKCNTTGDWRSLAQRRLGHRPAYAQKKVAKSKPRKPFNSDGIF